MELADMSRNDVAGLSPLQKWALINDIRDAMVEVGVDYDLSGFTVTLVPQLASATQTSSDAPITVELEDGWTAVIPVDPGGGAAMVDPFDNPLEG